VRAHALYPRCQALDIVILVVVGVRCASQLHLWVPPSGWGCMDCGGGLRAGVQGGAGGIGRISTITTAEGVAAAASTFAPVFVFVDVHIHSVSAVSVVRRGTLFVVAHEATLRVPVSEARAKSSNEEVTESNLVLR
jgi:hypothetical protein